MKRKHYIAKPQHIGNQSSRDSIAYAGGKTKEVQGFVGGGRQFKTSKRENLYFLGTTPSKNEPSSTSIKPRTTKKEHNIKTEKNNGNRRFAKYN